MKKILLFLKGLSPLVMIATMCILLLFAAFSQYSACRARADMRSATEALCKKYDNETKGYKKIIQQLAVDKVALAAEGVRKEERIAQMDAERSEAIRKMVGYEVLAVDASMEKGKIIEEYNKMRGFYLALQQIVEKDTAEILELKSLVENRNLIIAKTEEAYAATARRLDDCEFNFNLYRQSYGPKGTSLLTKVAVGGGIAAVVVIVLKVTKVIK